MRLLRRVRSKVLRLAQFQGRGEGGSEGQISNEAIEADRN